VLTTHNDAVVAIFLKECHASLQQYLAERKRATAGDHKKKEVKVQVDDAIMVQQLRSIRRGVTGDEVEDGEEDLESDVSRAAGMERKSLALSQPRIFQLTGYSDPLYAEVTLVIHQFDILFDILVFNQTKDTLQNVALELSTIGDLKLVERPQMYTIGPNDCISIRANIKVSSTETGIIFGNIVYDVAGSASVDSNCVVLNDIHIDIMDYIHPATCTEAEFRQMWAEFEWENKVAVHTNITDVKKYLDHILRSTNMNCLTPLAMIDDDCGFLAANLYAKSVFGEHALLNLGIERQTNGQLAGHVRIRSKTQGIALSLGDKITQNQRAPEH
jgi:coatomer subunit beta